MPIYEYGCKECGHIFEELQRSTDPVPDRCPSCGAEAVERVISRSSFLLRGGGWYAQDYSSTPTSPSSDVASTATTEAAPGSSEGAGAAKASETPKAKEPTKASAPPTSSATE